MPSVTRKSQKTRADRRERIARQLLAVVEQMLQGGETYTELSVERLVAEAGISRSTFYVYFEDKGELLRELTTGVMEEIVTAAGIWWNLPPEATKEDLREALREVLQTYTDHHLLMGAVVEAASYDVAVGEGYTQAIKASAKGVADHIRAGQAAGYVHAELDPKRTAEWLTWMTERGCYQLLPKASKAELDKLLTALTDVVWNTLYAQVR